MTNDEIANDVFANMSVDEINSFKKVSHDDLLQFHNNLGTFIRNTYSLWDNKWTPKIVNDIDVSDEHPDNRSFLIITLIHKMCLQS